MNINYLVYKEKIYIFKTTLTTHYGYQITFSNDFMNKYFCQKNMYMCYTMTILSVVEKNQLLVESLLLSKTTLTFESLVKNQLDYETERK